MSYILSDEGLGKIRKVLEEEKKKAKAAKDYGYLVELNKVEYLAQTGGGIVKKESPYLNYISECMKEAEKDGSQAGTRLNFKTCALRWKDMPSAERKKYEKGGLEVINLPGS